MVFDVVHVHRLGYPESLVEISEVRPEMVVVLNLFYVAHNVRMIDLIESHERGEHADVGFGKPVAREIALLAKN